ncbi:PREDICTED: uncharacterized protein LOC109243303 [Nicotiana attenuata]|uniref:uncharacterized protein LOC109243303 n=1 Tax=Nicotiana attenuata TaxID=49451 RepID=UPI000905835A|nr:PREDICTED: uncharacterized protein LOC109243303 [Nicotiana attenuata]
MGSEFEMSMMGELNFFLGLQVKQNSKGFMVSQYKYIKELLKRFEMENYKTIDTPLPLLLGWTWINLILLSMKLCIGVSLDLQYLTASTLDIFFSVWLCAKFQSSPKESHLKVAKRILRYLKGMQDLVLFYPSRDNFDLIGYANVDYAGYLMDRKSTSGITHFLGSCLISWGT